jgi:hypothetical protein
VRPCEQLGNSSRSVGETVRVDHSRGGRLGDAYHGRHAVGFDQFDFQVVVIDQAAGQRGNFGHWDSLSLVSGFQARRVFLHLAGHFFWWC